MNTQVGSWTWCEGFHSAARWNFKTEREENWGKDSDISSVQIQLSRSGSSIYEKHFTMRTSYELPPSFPLFFSLSSLSPVSSPLHFYLPCFPFLPSLLHPSSLPVSSFYPSHSPSFSFFPSILCFHTYHLTLLLSRAFKKLTHEYYPSEIFITLCECFSNANVYMCVL